MPWWVIGNLIPEAMVRGTPCPVCGNPLLSFGRFLCEVDVDSVLDCEACGTTLRRSRAVLGMLGALGVGFLLAAFSVVRVTLQDPTGTSIMVLALVLVAAPPAFLLLAKFLSWRYIPWKPLDPVARRPVVGA
jgi:uncharacterized protein (DUF983 family)